MVPVADGERAKAFYTGLGWRQDAEFSAFSEIYVAALKALHGRITARAT